MRIAINQPYFIPYAGWFRLLSSVDMFVIYDDVQFSYPSYVHRNKLTKYTDQYEWLTIPIKKKPLETKIKDIEFADYAYVKWPDEIRKFQVFDQDNMLTAAVSLGGQFSDPCRFIITTMKLACDIMGIRTPIVISSQSPVRPDLRGQDRVLAICEHFKATEYINAPGGVDLYDRETFKERGIELKFLTPYPNTSSILERLSYENPNDVRAEIEQETKFQ